MFKQAMCLAGLLVFGAQAGAAPWVRVTTSMGEFTIELNPQRSPLTVANFLKYVNEGFYDGTVFHRVVGAFVVQGGGFTSTDYKLKPTHESIANESGNGLRNLRGTVGLARAESPHSGNAQFYVNLADNPDLDPVFTRWGYAVFGKVVQGMEVVERIGVMPTGTFGPFKAEAPLQPVVIQKVQLLSTSPVPELQPQPRPAPPPPATPPPEATPPGEAPPPSEAPPPAQ